MNEKYTEVNSKAWDSWAEMGNEWTIPISHDAFVRAKNGAWDYENMCLTPCIIVPKKWFEPFMQSGRLDGVNLLGLACGGGQQMPVFAGLGAICTVFDNSAEQLERERIVCAREGYKIEVIKGDMTVKLPFHNCTFDIIFHPVSNVYVEDVNFIWNECFRVLKPGGMLLSGLDNGLNFLIEDAQTLPLIVANKLPYNPLKDADLAEKCLANNWGYQFSHSLEEQIGGQLAAGFVLTDLYEDRDLPGGGLLRDFAPQYLATRSVKPK